MILVLVFGEFNQTFVVHFLGDFYRFLGRSAPVTFGIFRDDAVPKSFLRTSCNNFFNVGSGDRAVGDLRNADR